MKRGLSIKARKQGRFTIKEKGSFAAIQPQD
jgi:hypothetical protein